MSTDPFVAIPLDRTTPARRWFAITPHASTNIPIQPKAIYVGTPGDVAAVGDDDAVVVFKNVSGILQISPKRINVIGTDAQDIVGLTDPTGS